MDKKHRRWKKNVKRNLKIIAKKIPLAFESGREKRNWIKQCLREHPAVKGQNMITIEKEGKEREGDTGSQQDQNGTAHSR